MVLLIYIFNMKKVIFQKLTCHKFPGTKEDLPRKTYPDRKIYPGMSTPG